MDNRTSPSDHPILVVVMGGNVIGLDPLTGKQIWAHKERLAGHQRLAIEGDHVFVLHDACLVCLEYLTGSLVWRIEVSSMANSLLVGGSLIWISGGGEVWCIDRTGRIVWHEPFKGKGRRKIAVGVPGRVVQVDETD